jgi:hypothetical protein
MQLIPLFLLVFAWSRIEFRPNHSSNGIGSIILGSILFGFGAVNLTEWDKILSGAIVTVGLFIALVGAARYVIYEIKG